VYERPETKQVADYFGNCVYITGLVKNGIFTAPGISCPAAVPDGSYRIMLRPDSLELHQGGNYPLQVEEISFRGTDSLISLRGPDGTHWKKSHIGHVPFAVGATLEARLNIEKPLLFPISE
jgi:ABC-type Fe3+/spermidine/putrescine transport system ATPase subunit